MKNKFFDNLPLKIISLLLAFCLWLLIMNTIKPVVNGAISIPITIENENILDLSNKSYELDNNMCRITYYVNQDISNMIRQSDFKVYVDMKELSDKNVLPIHFETLNNLGISSVDINPKEVHVELSDIITTEVPVSYATNGNLENGCSIGGVILSPNVVYVSGIDDVMKNVTNVLIDIPLNKENESFSGVTEAKVIGADGKEIVSGIKLNTNEINYSVVVFNTKTVTLNPVIEGNVKQGYTYAGTQVYPSSIVIEGPRSVLDNIYSLDLPTINVDNLSENQEFIFPINSIVPAGIKCNSVAEVKINIAINDNVLNKNRISNDNIGPSISDDINE